MNWMIQNDVFYIPQLKIVFHYKKKKDKANITKLYNYKFPGKLYC